ncbi:tRNA modification GTPase, partial [Pseudomonadota bacterium]
MTTIFAPITSIGVGGVTIVRISGEKVVECLRALNINFPPKEREATLYKIKNPKSGDILDEAMVVYFKAPKSFTGEDVCELNLHSSSYIISKVIEILGSVKDVRMAEPGEFSKRAFLNNKIDLTQAEAICDLINSETEAQQKQAIMQLQGYMKDFYDELREEVIDLISNIEAYIDFPEEDLPKNVVSDIKEKVRRLRRKISSHLEDGKIGEKIRGGIFITILGSPNVGKSTLLNYLAKRDIAIVSNIQGTTRDVIEVSLNLNGLPA